jgi:alkanesulfonate monooxygenase SsuD/methylene tetrahydromethanopterin reductase-like flavin-dependent oxidoreductase (luciferase family)
MTHPLRFGLVVPPMWRTWDEILDLFQRAERADYDAAFLTDHFLSDWDGEGGAVLEAWTTLAAIAREVPRIMIGTYVTSVTHRYPAVLAKQAVTVDHLSGGRLILGIGAAWNDREHRAYGIRFPAPRDRVDLAGETLEALHLLETVERPSMKGSHISLEEAPFFPRPINGHLPILIGSRGRRMLRHVAHHADYWDLAKSSPEEIVRLGGLLRNECRRIGRDPNAIVWMHEAVLEEGKDPWERIEWLAPLGVSFFLVNAWPKRSPSLVDRVPLPR